MADDPDWNKLFNEYFNELEGFCLRSERYYAEIEALGSGRGVEWLKAAFIAGAKAMAQNTLDVVSDLDLQVNDDTSLYELFLDHYTNCFYEGEE